jgi:hypothetical protein
MWKVCRVWNSYSGVYEELSLLGCNAVRSVENNRRFGETCSLHVQGRRIKQTRRQREAVMKLLCGFLLTLFCRQNGSDMFHRNVGWLSTDITAFCRRRWNSNFSLLTKCSYCTPSLAHMTSSCSFLPEDGIRRCCLVWSSFFLMMCSHYLSSLQRWVQN